MKFTVSLKKNIEFRQMYKEGRPTGNGHLTLFAKKNELGQNRLGICVSKKMGKAVSRNRQKRRIKEAYKSLEINVSQGFDIVILPKASLADAKFSQIVSAMSHLLKKQGLLKI